MELNAEDLTPGISVDFAILADAVQAAGGKLYVLGGGWDTLFVASFPGRHHSLGIGLRIRVPWTMTHERLTVTIDLQDEDGKSIFEGRSLTHAFQVGRPKGLPEGSDVVVVRAFTFNNVPLPKPGGYSFVIGVDGVERSRLRFWARAAQLQA